MTEDPWEAPCCRSPSSSARCQSCGFCPIHCDCRKHSPEWLDRLMGVPMCEDCGKNLEKTGDKCQDCGDCPEHCECEDLSEVARQERARLKKAGALKESQTPFGLLTVLQTPMLAEPRCWDCSELVKDCECERCSECGDLWDAFDVSGAKVCWPCYKDHLGHE